MVGKKDKIPKIIGNVKIYVLKGNKWIKKVDKKNVITNVGLSQAIKLIFGVDTNVFKYIAIGTGTTTPSENDTQLENEIQRFSASAEYFDPHNVKLTAVGVVNQDANITEAGVFNSESNGVMLARQVFEAVSVSSGDPIKVVWEFSF